MIELGAHKRGWRRRASDIMKEQRFLSRAAAHKGVEHLQLAVNGGLAPRIDRAGRGDEIALV